MHHVIPTYSVTEPALTIFVSQIILFLRANVCASSPRKIQNHLRFQSFYKRLDVLSIFRWCPEAKSCLDQGTISLQIFLKTMHFLAPPNP